MPGFFRTTLTLAVSGLIGLAGCVEADTPDSGTKISAAEAVEDLDRLYEGLQSADAGLFAETPKRVFDQAYSELQTSWEGPVSTGKLYEDLQRFVALARHGHTRIDMRHPDWQAFREGNGKVFPLTFEIENGEVRIAAAPEGSGAQPGDTVRAFEGEANPIWLARLTRNISAETPSLAYAQLSGAEPYYVWMEYGARDAFDIEVERGGETRKVRVDAVAFDTWLNDGAEEAQGFSLAGRDARMIGETIGYLRPGPFFNINAETPEEAYDPDALQAYLEFVDAAFEDFIEAGVSDLILDLRDNPGGDSSFSDPVVAWFADEPFRFASDFRVKVSPETTGSNQARIDALGADASGMSVTFAELFAAAEPGEFVSVDIPYAEPRSVERFEGEVHVLVNRLSFSNAVSTAALIQDYDFGTIYGEPTRDMATTYGAMEHFTLPNSGFRVGYPKAHIIRPNGEERSHPLTPDVLLPVPTTRGAEDGVLEELVARISAD